MSAGGRVLPPPLPASLFTSRGASGGGERLAIRCGGDAGTCSRSSPSAGSPV